MTMTGKQIKDGKLAAAQIGIDNATANKAEIALPLVDATDYGITEVAGRIHGYYGYTVTPVDDEDDGKREVSRSASLTRAKVEAAPKAVKDWLIAYIEANGKWS